MSWLRPRPCAWHSSNPLLTVRFSLRTPVTPTVACVAGQPLIGEADEFTDVLRLFSGRCSAHC
jgi:hypothetical protein